MATNNVLPLDSLDRKIVAALQVNGRAGWRKVSSVIDAPERTVTAHGTELLRRGVVRVTGLTLLPRGGVPVASIIELRCFAGMPRVAAAAIAARPNVLFTYVTTGDTDCLSELMTSDSRVATVLLDELPGIPGVSRITTSTVLRHYRAMHQWRPGILDPEQVAELNDPEQPWEPTRSTALAALSREEMTIANVLASDGRASVEDLARAAGISSPSARRRLSGLLDRGRLFFRAVVEPRALGFPIEAFLWIRTVPANVDAVATKLLEAPELRYLAFITGRYQLLAHVAFPDQESLGIFVTGTPWVANASEVNVAVVLSAFKRSGLRSAGVDDDE